MADPVLLVLVLIGGLLAAVKIRAYLGARARRQERDATRTEDARVRGCRDVVLFFANQLGYVAREAISRDELEGLIDSGISPEDLAAEIWSRCQIPEALTLGYHPLPDSAVPVQLPPRLRDRHLYVVGKSGSGKTTLLRHLILQDLAAGRGLAVLAPEAELLTEEILPFVPQSRWDDLIVVNPADVDQPVPLNPLHVDPGDDLDLKVDETLTIFHRLFHEEGTSAPRTEALLRNALYALMQVPGSTLLDIEKLLDRDDATYRKWVAGQVPDEATRTFWRQTYAAFPKDAHLPLLSRMGRFLRPRFIRQTLCQPGAGLDIRQAMDRGQVLLFNLSDGLLGETNAQILGQLVVAKIQMAAMSRADTAKEARRPFYLYIDEFQSFCGVAATSYEKILSRARKYRLGLILAHQQTGQIPEKLLKEILGNVSTVVSFAVSAGDANRMAREMVGEINGVPVPLDPHDLLTLRVGEAFAKIERSVFRLKTYPPPEIPQADAGMLMRASRARYGRAAAIPPAPAGDYLDQIDPDRVF